MKIVALVAARSGSERVKNENMRKFSGKTLLEYKLEQLMRIKLFDGVVLNSNDCYVNSAENFPAHQFHSQDIPNICVLKFAVNVISRERTASPKGWLHNG